MAIKIGFKAIVPKKPLWTGDVTAVLRGAVDKARKPIEEDLNAVTETWNHKVKFKVRWNTAGNNIEMTITTNDKVFIYVNDGTRPHVIQPRTARRLVFQSGYTAKSTVGSLRSRRGGKSGPTVYAKLVHHPGNEARKFDELVAKKHKNLLQKEVDAAIKKAIGRK